MNAWGVFQAYYEETLLKDSSPSDMYVFFAIYTFSDREASAWIGSVQVFLSTVSVYLSNGASQYSMVFLPALLSGHYFDRGHLKIPFFLSSALVVAATFLVGQCTKYWHFLLCQGFAVGVRLL